MAELKNGILKEIYDKSLSHFIGGIDPAVHVGAYVGEHEWGFAESEFAGKYIDICVQFYRKTGDARLLDNVKRVVESVMANQRPDGYIGGYHKDHEFDNFSVWNQAFTAYGMTSYYELTGDPAVLESAERCVTYTANHYLGHPENDILECSNFGTQHSSILIALPRLYTITGKKIYLEFAEHIINRLKNSDNNFFEFDSILDLRSKKGIENFVILIGLIMYGEITGDRTVLSGCRKYWNEVAEKQIGMTGNGTLAEFWTEEGNTPAFLALDQKPNENCVAVGWCEFSYLLFEIDREAKYLDELEKSVFNHLLGSLDEKCRDFAYYQPNFGEKVTVTSDSMYKCCRYRGYSAISMLPGHLYFRDGDTVYPLLYTESSYDEDGIHIEQKTAYPFGDTVRFTVTGKATLKLRIPAWCKTYTLTVNGQKDTTAPVGGFITLSREFVGEEIVLGFHTEVTPVHADIDGDPYMALSYGTVLLALDSHFGNDVFETALPATPALTPVPGTAYRMEFTAPGQDAGKDATVHIVDYATAGKKAAGDKFTVWVKVQK